MIAQTELIRKLEGFDETFFLYGEDQDLALRVRRSGFEIGFIENALVSHYGGRSEETGGAMWEKKVRAENLFYRKHYRLETIRRIRRAELLKAAWRRATLRLTLPFAINREAARAKLARYETITRFTRRMIEEERSQAVGTGAR
jgi:GT2 family glycosyltransferase